MSNPANMTDNKMTDEPKHEMIHEAILAVMQEVGPIAKEGKNEQQNYKFRGIDQVYNRVHPLFIKHGIYTTCTILHAEHKSGTTKNGGTNYISVVNMEYQFRCKDGSFVTTQVVAEGIDSSDKASNKAMAAAHKYALFQILMIPIAFEDSEKNDYEKPKQDTSAPKSTPRAERKTVSGIKVDEAKSLFIAFTKKHPEYMEIDFRPQFKTWVCELNKRDFDPFNGINWDRAELNVCLKDLENH